VAIKSLVASIDIDQALRAHDCQANARHRIQGGDWRLKVRNGLGWNHYCMPCAKKIVQRDLEKLQKLAQRVTAILPD
jgi:hypothetical protein